MVVGMSGGINAVVATAVGDVAAISDRNAPRNDPGGRRKGRSPATSAARKCSRVLSAGRTDAGEQSLHQQSPPRDGGSLFGSAVQPRELYMCVWKVAA